MELSSGTAPVGRPNLCSRALLGLGSVERAQYASRFLELPLVDTVPGSKWAEILARAQRCQIVTETALECARGLPQFDLEVG